MSAPSSGRRGTYAKPRTPSPPHPGCPPDWLNDAVKGYLSDRGDFHPYLESSNLRVLTAAPEYLLAMKCMAMRLGEEFHDEDDVRFLLRYLNLTDYQAQRWKS